ncbi:MAG TPA: hypothetical protein VIG72_03585 [Pontibacter sp.]
MKLQEIIVVLIIAALFIVPMAYFRTKQKRKTRGILNALSQLNGLNLSITEFDSWNDIYAIGLDKVQKKLVYTKNSGKGKIQQVIDLTTVTRCELISNYQDVNGNRVFEAIKLQVAFSNPNQQEIALEFYSNQNSLSVNEELQLATKWQNIVKAQLQTEGRKAAAIA